MMSDPLHSQSGIRPGLFLDRDGTVIEEKHYLSRSEDVELLPTVGQTIARMNSLGIPVAVVTNQAGIARGYFPESQIAKVHARVDELLAAFNARIDHYEYCPHHPVEGLGDYRIDCDCRKPKPGMLTRSAGALQIDLPRSLMVGDRMGDLEAGANAGCHSSLVRTGYGSSISLDFDPKSLRFLGAFQTLEQAVDAWLNLK
ncbi:MAG: HAD family hydrolase [Planctomycetaceae bacterium]